MTIKTGVMAAALLMLAGCTAPSQHAAVETCKADNQMQQTTLYFGLNRPAGAQITGCPCFPTQRRMQSRPFGMPQHTNGGV